MDQIIYLDNGATSFPKPEEVYLYMDYFYRNYGVNPGRSGYDLCMETGEVVENTRKMMTKFFNGTDPNRLVFSYNSTDALNLIMFGLLQPGDHAVSTTVEHNSVLRPLYHLQRDGVEVEFVPFDASGFVDPDEIEKRIKKNTKLVIVNHASNVIGTIQPVGEIGRRCRKHGVVFAIDASQSAGKIPIDMEAMNIDIVAFTGHKSLLGPTGIGGMYVREGIDIRHTRAGGTGVRSAVKYHLDEYPYRMEYGTHNVVGIAGLNAGIKWILDKGMGALHEHEMKLTDMLRKGLKDVDGVTLYVQDDLTDHISVFLFNVDGMEAMNTGTILDVDYNHENNP
ncbi:MAG: aminotransferase class V-fold PLP-dependent enzyme, partial [Acidobacteria bacterium]|nr:aminotransferase class V-fold PLP-dependent enzyme [Acidobacteriota bacterium]